MKHYLLVLLLAACACACGTDKPTIDIDVASEADQPVLAVLRSHDGTYVRWFWVGVRTIVEIAEYPVDQRAPTLMVVSVPGCELMSQRPPTGLPVGGLAERTGALIDQDRKVFTVLRSDLPEWPVQLVPGISSPCPLFAFDGL